MSKAAVHPLEQLYREVCWLVESFARETASKKDTLKKLLAVKQQEFCIASVRLLAAAPGMSSGIRYLAHLLSDKLSFSLLDTAYLRAEEAIAAARIALAAGVKLHRHLEEDLKAALTEEASFASVAKVLRILDLLEICAAPECWNCCQIELMAHSDAKVRSRAALLIGRGTKNVSWLSRVFMNCDARIQANAVEAMWDLPMEQVHPLLSAATRSANNRVAANALLGLYRFGDSSSVTGLLKMAQHSDPRFCLSAVWAIGQTADPRFIPYLMQRFKESDAKMRFAITRALAQLRRREKAAADAGAFDIRIFDVAVTADGGRRIAFTIGGSGENSRDDLKAGDIAVFEGGSLIEHYEIKTTAKPELALFGFVMPRFLDSTDQEGRACNEGLRHCLAMRRPADLWRIDQFLMQRVDDEAISVKESNLPYDDAVINNELKMRRGFFGDSSRIEKALGTIVPRERAADDAVEALTRQFEAIGNFSGKRNVIVLLNQSAAAELDGLNPDELREQLRTAGITLHCISTSEGGWAPLREVCKSAEGCTFTDTSVDQLPRSLEIVYLRSLKRFELAYQKPADTLPETVTIKITSNQGAGCIDLALDRAVRA